jgi:hypothetical protein
VATIALEWHPSRAAALDAERDEIKAKRPPYNVTHSGNLPPRIVRMIEASEVGEAVRARVRLRDSIAAYTAQAEALDAELERQLIRQGVVIQTSADDLADRL